MRARSSILGKSADRFRRIAIKYFRRARLALPSILILAHVCASDAQQIDVVFSRYTTEHGLAQNRAQGVVQDRHGFIWIGTQQGLQRFDGYAFLQYVAPTEALENLLDGSVWPLYYDRRGRIWVTVDWRVLVRFDPESGDYDLRRFAVGPSKLVHRMGTVVFPADTLFYVLNVDAPLSEARSVGSFNRTSAFCLSSNGVLWYAIAGKLRAARVEGDSLTPEHIFSELYTRVNDLECDARGRVWIATDVGLKVLSDAGSWVQAVNTFPQSAVTDITFGHDRLWAIAEKNMVIYATRRDTSVTLIVPGSAEAVNFGSLLIDSSEAVWFGSLSGGLYRANVSQQHFHRLEGPMRDYFVTALHQSADGLLWVGTLDGGAFVMDLTGMRPASRILLAFEDGSTTLDYAAWGIHSLRNGSLLLGTNKGLCRLAINAETARCFPPTAGLRIHMIAPSNTEDQLWIATNRRPLLRFELESSTLAESKFADRGAVNLVLSVYQDEDNLLVGSQSHGLLRYEPLGDKLTTYPCNVRDQSGLVGCAVYEIVKVKSGQMWLGTTRGLSRFDLDSGRFENLGEEVGLPPTTVFSIEPVGENLWLGTGHGLIRYSPKSGAVRRFGLADGVVTSEFNRRASLRLQDGRVVFGGIDGVTIFDPDLVADDPTAPIVLTAVTRFGRSGVMRSMLFAPSELRLGPRDVGLSIEFAALSFGDAASNRYRYRLHGVDPVWRESGSARSVTYARLSPGKYNFRAQYTVGNAPWVESGASATVIVTPPFWRTWWFVTIAAIVVVGVAWFAHRLRLKRLLELERLRFRIAGDLHDDVGAGLGGIALLGDQALRSKRLGERERGQLEKISRTARDLSGELRDIVWSIDPELDSPEDLKFRMHQTAADLLGPIPFTLDVDGELPRRLGMATRRDLLLIFKEALHNIEKHAEASAVRAVLCRNGERLVLRVTDDGIGFDTDRAATSTGLKSMRARAERLGGELTIDSAPGSGTTIEVATRMT